MNTKRKHPNDVPQDESATRQRQIQNTDRHSPVPQKRQKIASHKEEKPVYGSSSRTFDLPSLSSVVSQQVPFQLPTQIISFSYDEKHVMEFTDSALRYYVEPPQSADLKYGYDRWIRKQDTRGRLDSLLHAINKVKKDRGSLGQVGLVSWRGTITKLLTAPYEERDAFELNVMYANGTLFLEEHLTNQRLFEKNNMDPRQSLQTYFGYSFESYCTSNLPVRSSISNDRAQRHPSGWGGDVDTNVQWCSVIRTKLGDVRMVLGGEVDCVREKYTGRTDTFVELKTSLVIRGPPDAAKFERKLLKFYFQSFLLGVPEIVVGFRTPSGQVTTTQTFKTIEIPRLVRGKPGGWDPLVCLNWVDSLFKFLKNQIDDGHKRVGTVPVWRIKFVPKKGMSVEQLDEVGIQDVVNGEDRVGFLPRWFWDELEETRITGNEPRIAHGETSSAIGPLEGSSEERSTTAAASGWNI